jgi:NAD-dependent dihydropyrimidine dehydrogenase PreA subunit
MDTLPHSQEAPLIDTNLPYIDFKNMRLEIISETHDLIYLRIFGLTFIELKHIREAFSHLPIMTTQQVEVKKNNTISENEVLKITVRNIALDVDSDNYDTKEENRGKDKLIYLALTAQGIKNSPNIFYIKNTPYAYVTTYRLGLIDMHNYSKGMKSNDDNNSCEISTIGAEDVILHKPIAFRRMGQDYPNITVLRTPDDVIQTVSRTNPMHDPTETPGLCIYATADKRCEYGEPNREFAIYSKCAYDNILEFKILTEKQRSLLIDYDIDALEKLIKKPNSPRLDLIKEFDTFLQNNPGIIRLDTIIEFQSKKSSELKKYSAVVSFVNNISNARKHFLRKRNQLVIAYEDDTDMLATSSNYDYIIDQQKRIKAQKNSRTCQPNAVEIVSKCPNMVFDVDAAFKHNKLVVKNPHLCDRNGLCVRADVTDTLYFQPKQQQMWMFVQSTGVYSAACVMSRGVQWIAEQSFESWTKATLINPSPMTDPHPSYASTDPKFNHFMGPKQNKMSYMAIKHLWKQMKTNPAWMTVRNDKNKTYTESEEVVMKPWY